jgi:hypothetical protein
MGLDSLIGGTQATEAWRLIRSIKKEQELHDNYGTGGEALFRTFMAESAVI